MIYLICIINLNIISLISIVIGVHCNTTIQLLLVVVIIVFTQGISLITIGSSIIGSYLIIIYIGAIVILFAFCILFINSKELKEEKMKKLHTISLGGIFFLIWEGITSTITYKPMLSDFNNFFNITPEINYLIGFSKGLYDRLILPLGIMILVLILGLILVIKIIGRPDTN